LLNLIFLLFLILSGSGLQELSHWIRILKDLQRDLEGGRGQEDANTDEEEDDDDDDDDGGVLAKEAEVQKLSKGQKGDKAGFLLKRGKSTSTYRRRWFVLHDKILYYFSSPNVRLTFPFKENLRRLTLGPTK